MKNVPIQNNSTPAIDPGATEGTSECPVCGTRFRCGIGAGGTECWCFGLPPLSGVESGGRCLCPACLHGAIDREQGQ